MSLVASLLFNDFDFPPPPPLMPRNKQEKAALHPNSVAANNLKRERALSRYKAVMGDEWVKTFEIGRRLGASSGSLQRIMRGWYHAGLIERRDADKGYEWRMK